MYRTASSFAWSALLVPHPLLPPSVLAQCLASCWVVSWFGFWCVCCCALLGWRLWLLLLRRSLFGFFALSRAVLLLCIVLFLLSCAALSFLMVRRSAARRSRGMPLLCPPPRWLLSMLCGVLCLATWYRGSVWAVLCGLRCFPVLCCALLVCWCLAWLVYCRALLLVLWLSVSPWRWLRRFCWCRVVPCCAVLFAVLFCRVWCCRVLLCAVVFSFLLCGVVVCCVIWCAAVQCGIVLVVSSCPALQPPACCCPCCLAAFCLLPCCAVSCCAVVRPPEYLYPRA